MSDRFVQIEGRTNVTRGRAGLIQAVLMAVMLATGSTTVVAASVTETGAVIQTGPVALPAFPGADCSTSRAIDALGREGGLMGVRGIAGVTDPGDSMVKTGDYVLRPAYNGQTITHVIYIRANCLRRLGQSIFLSSRH